MTDGLSQNNMYPFFRLRASYNGENTSSANPLYISYNSSTPNNANLAKVAGGNQSIGLTEKTTTDITKVSLTADAAPYYVDEAITLTATATPSPSGTDRVSSLVIEQEVEGVWTPVGTAYAGSDVAGVAEKDATTKTVTVTYEFTPAAEGTFNFRAHAVVDGEDQYSTAEASAGGDGDVVEVIATVKQIAPKNSSYTLTLIDKDGNELLTETNVPANRITSVNSLTNRNGDPFDNAYRSPLVTTYKYYKGTAAGKPSAQEANDEMEIRRQELKVKEINCLFNLEKLKLESRKLDLEERRCSLEELKTKCAKKGLSFAAEEAKYQAALKAKQDKANAKKKK